MTLWRSYCAAGLAVVCVYLLLPAGLARDAVYLAVGVSSVAAICAGLRTHRPAARAPWILFAVGQAAWVVGDAVYSWDVTVRGVSPFPSLADAAYLGAYPLLAAGVALMIRRRGLRSDVPGLIDGAVVVVSVGLVTWTWFARPLFTATDVSAFERVLTVAYPVGDILLLAMLVRLVAAPGTVSTPFRLLAGAVVLQVLADSGLASQLSSSGVYSSSLDLLWLASYVLWGASALHPQMVDLVRHPGARRDRFTMRRVAALGVAVMLPPVTVITSMVIDRPVDAPVVIGAAVVLPLLVLARMACAVGVIRLTTGQRDRLQDELFFAAAHDPLTGLFNRAYLLRQTEVALRRAQETGGATGLLVIDVDRFTALNDDWGPTTGDVVLIEVADRIRDVVGASCSSGRLGDDQFVVLVDALGEDSSVELADALLSALQKPCTVGGHVISLTVRIGVSVSLDAGDDAAALLREALSAVRRAKELTIGSVEVFDHRMRREHQRRTEIERALRGAIAHGDLELLYQPVVAATTEVIDGYEALVRWNLEDGTTRMPVDFIPYAEMTDLICEVDRWVLGAATRQLAAWLELDPRRFAPMTIAVNISGRHLADPAIVDDVATALETSGLPARHLVIEVTETVLVDVPNALMQLDAIRALGVSVSLDDFGTGYTSIGQLRHLPIDTVKIDRSFLTSQEPGAAELVALMTAAAHACGMLVVAEGVETLDQLEVVRRLQCDAAQGFLFDHPLRADHVVTGDRPGGRPHLHIVPDPTP